MSNTAGPREWDERLNFLLITALSHYTIIILHKENHDKWPLDGERHKAVVLPDVPLEDVGAGAQHPLKSRPVELDTPDNITNNSSVLVITITLLIISLEKKTLLLLLLLL